MNESRQDPEPVGGILALREDLRLSREKEKRRMTENGTLHDAFLDELRDLYDAEKQLTKALPKLAKTATSPKLREAFESHLEETRGHVERLEQGFEEVGEETPGK